MQRGTTSFRDDPATAVHHGSSGELRTHVLAFVAEFWALVHMMRARVTFTDLRLCVVIVDRLTCGGNIVENGTDSCVG